ncbi:hypothetical protein SteCoe_19752 [Stentor coeruleus]|uniref:Uncharacterized protein n=1 Tax=Stentor coeruleus TaxID=5963 RepID=A0A1R2BTC1_9CILI|nr:hypothetical protein SteCoe_19752 [Stentor coeruleus]
MESEFKNEAEWIPKPKENDDRKGFIKKVYGILCTQLAFTCIIVTMGIQIEAFKEWLTSNFIFLIVCFSINIITVLILICMKRASRKYPMNYILLFTFTITEAFLVANVAAYYASMTVLIAAILTLSVTMGVTVYAFRHKERFLFWPGTIWGLTFGCLVLVIFFIVFYDSLLVNLFICAAIIILYTLFLVFDTQRIVNSGRWGLSYDDYIIAALCVYIDIIGLFLYILRFLKK